MKVPSYISRADQDKVLVPEEQKWIHEILEHRDKQILRLTQALQASLDFAANFNCYVVDFSAKHNTQYTIAIGVTKGAVLGVIPLYNEFFDHCQVSWEPVDGSHIKVTPFFREAPTGEAKLRLLILGGG